jgi:Phosphodiester glycosidase
VSTRYVPVGRIAAGIALAVGVWVLAHGAAEPRWRSLQPGVEFAIIRGEPYCRHGSADIALLRVDPTRVGLKVLHFSRQPDRKPLALPEWQQRARALAVFNAGQYYPDLSYMGVLVSDGEPVFSRPHPSFRAALVAGARARRDAKVLDLSHVPIEKARREWREIAQSFMLFDENGRRRVKKTDQVANRTVVGEDRRGRLVIVTSEGGYTLWDFAELLQRSPLQLTHAMSMDGGHEAGMCVVSGRFRYATFGRWKDGQAPDGAMPLPAVIAVMP